jgi:hypothetical protein
MKRKSLKKQMTTARRKGPTPLYVYAERENNTFAHRFGKAEFGSYSAYINHLITMDRTRVQKGVKPIKLPKRPQLLTGRKAVA